MKKIILITFLFLNFNLSAFEKLTEKELWLRREHAVKQLKCYPKQSVEWKYYFMKERSVSKSWKYFHRGLINLSINIEKFENLRKPLQENPLHTLATKLNTHPQRPKGICINPAKISKTKLKNGICSALSLHFAANYLGKRQQELIVERLFLICSEYTDGASEEIGLTQNIFDAIEITPEGMDRGYDILWAKMQFLANLYSLVLEPATDVFTLRRRNSMMKKVERLPEGVYFIRLLQPLPLKVGEKGEIKGHTQVLIKEKEKYYLYDPNFGVGEIKCKGLVEVWGYYRSFYLEEMRLYRVR